MQTTTQNAIKWGAISGVIGIILITVNYALNLDASDSSMKYVIMVASFAVTIIVLIMAMKEFKSENGGFMTYSQGLGIGAMTGGVSGIIGGIWSYIYLSFIDPTHMETLKQYQISKMEEQGLSSDQIEQASKFTEMFTGPGTIIAFSIIGSIFIYFIISLIVSAVQKNEKPAFE